MTERQDIKKREYTEINFTFKTDFRVGKNTIIRSLGRDFQSEAIIIPYLSIRCIDSKTPRILLFR